MDQQNPLRLDTSLPCWITGLDVPQPVPAKVRRRDRRSRLRKVHHVTRMVNQLFRHWRLLRRVDDPSDRFAGHRLGTSWARALLSELGIRVQMTGAPLMLEPGLYIGNHQSFLDVLVWMASAPCSFLGKDAVSKAPMIGWGATTLGTVWVRRSEKSSRQAAREALARGVLQEGRRVVVFAEGTTSVDGGPWRRGGFEVAAENQLRVQPAGLCFDNLRACVYLDQPFAKVLLDVLEAPPITCHLHLFEPTEVIDPERDRLVMEETVHDWLSDKLVDVGWDGQNPPPIKGGSPV